MKRLVALLGGLGLAITVVAQPRFDVDRMTVTNGKILSGNYLSLSGDDADYLYLSPLFKLGPMSLETQSFDPGRGKFVDDYITLLIQTSVASQVALEQVDLYDFSVGAWVTVYQHAEKYTLEHQISITVPTKRFMVPMLGLKRARLTWFDSGFPTKYIQVGQMSWK